MTMLFFSSLPFWCLIHHTCYILKQCLLKAWELILDLLYVEGFNYTISLLLSPIISVVLSLVILSLSESKWSTFYTHRPLATGLSQAYWAATMFPNSFPAINVSQSLFADWDNTITRSSPQGEDSNTTLVPTVPSTPAVPFTPTIVPPSGPPSPRSPPITHTLHVTDVWDSPPFSPIPSSPLSHSLWDMITNDEGISLEIWNQFIGGDVPSIIF